MRWGGREHKDYKSSIHNLEYTARLPVIYLCVGFPAACTYLMLHHRSYAHVPVGGMSGQNMK